MSSAPAPSPASSPGTGQGIGFLTGFDVKSTVLYIAISLGVLLFVTGILGFTLVYCSRPARRRERILAALERHRLAALQQAKDDEPDFKPQLRAVPVIIVQPGYEEVAFGKTVDAPSTGDPEALEAGISAPCIVASAADPEDPEVGYPSAADGSSRSDQSEPSSSGQAAGSSSSSSDAASEDPERGHIFYNPLTHYLTERRARYFTASVDI